MTTAVTPAGPRCGSDRVPDRHRGEGVVEVGRPQRDRHPGLGRHQRDQLVGVLRDGVGETSYGVGAQVGIGAPLRRVEGAARGGDRVAGVGELRRPARPTAAPRSPGCVPGRSSRRRWAAPRRPPAAPEDGVLAHGQLHHAAHPALLTRWCAAAERGWLASDTCATTSGADVPLPVRPATRVVSLVPSLTEALAAAAPEPARRRHRLVHPPRGPRRRPRARHQEPRPRRHPSPLPRPRRRQQGGEPRARRTPTPRRRRRCLGHPDRDRRGVTRLDVAGCFARPSRCRDPDWLVDARALWSARPPSLASASPSPIWRDPWMVVGSETYTDDLLARAGLTNVLADGPRARGATRRSTPDDIDGAGADVVLLPDEPYVFTADDGPEALRTPTRLVSGGCSRGTARRWSRRTPCCGLAE